MAEGRPASSNTRSSSNSMAGRQKRPFFRRGWRSWRGPALEDLLRWNRRSRENHFMKGAFQGPNRGQLTAAAISPSPTDNANRTRKKRKFPGATNRGGGDNR